MPSKGQRSNPKNFDVKPRKWYEIEKVLIDVKKKVIYGLSNDENIFDLGWPQKVEGRGQALKTLKSNTLKTVQDREKV